MLNDISLGTLGLFGFAGAILVIVACGFYTVTQQMVAVIARFGKYVRTEQPGLRLNL